MYEVRGSTLIIPIELLMSTRREWWCTPFDEMGMEAQMKLLFPQFSFKEIENTNEFKSVRRIMRHHCRGAKSRFEIPHSDDVKPTESKSRPITRKLLPYEEKDEALELAEQPMMPAAKFAKVVPDRHTKESKSVPITKKIFEPRLNQDRA